MITYLDTSALLKLLIEEHGSDQAAEVWDASPTVASSALVAVEARSALAAAVRGGRLTASQHRAAKRGVAELLESMAIVAVTPDLLDAAAELAEQDALRGYDAVHLAAAVTIEATVFASADATLCDAAARHGMHVANPLDP